LVERRLRADEAALSAGLMNSSSSTRWTMEPLVAWTLGGSGSFSMLAKRNAMGHDVNASTRLGDRLVGTGYMPPS
jgi:hypothetical protein